MSNNQEDFQLLVSPDDYLRLQAKCEQLESNQLTLTNQNRQMSRKIYDIKQVNIELTQKVNQLTDANAQLQKLGIQMSLKLNNLQSENQSMKTHVKQLQIIVGMKTKESLSQLKILQDKLNQTQLQNSKNRQELSEKDSNLSIVKNQNNALSLKIKSLSDQITDYVMKVAEKHAQYENIKKLLHQNQQQLDASSKKLQQITQKNKEANKQINSLIVELTNSRQQVKLLKDQISCLQNELKIQKQTAENIKCYSQQAKKTYKQIEQQIKKREEYIKQLQKNGSQTVSRIKTLQVEKQILEAEVQIKRIQNQKITSSYQQLMLKLTHNQKNMSQLKNTNCSHMQNVQELQINLNEALARAQQKQQHIKNLQGLIKKLEETQSIQNVKILQLKEQIKGKDNLLIITKKQYENSINDIKKEYQILRQSSQIAQKQYEQIIETMQMQIKTANKSRIKDKPQIDQLRQLKALIQEYFTQLAVNLYEVGNLDPQDIRAILHEQEGTVKQFVTDVTSPFIKSISPCLR